MTDSIEEERERIRERKRRKLLERHGGDGAAARDGAREQDGEDGDLNPVDEPEEPSSPTVPVSVEDEDHFRTILSEHALVLVDCYADWCGPCKMLEPTIDAIAAETPATVAKVDVDRHPFLAHQIGVQGVPTLVLYADGEPVKRLVGAQDRTTLETLIDRYA